MIDCKLSCPLPKSNPDIKQGTFLRFRVKTPMTGPSCNYVCAMRPSFDLNVNQCSSFLSDQTKVLNGLCFRFKISLAWRRQDIFSHPRSSQSAFGQLRRWIIHFLIWQKTVCWAWKKGTPLSSCLCLLTLITFYLLQQYCKLFLHPTTKY